MVDPVDVLSPEDYEKALEFFTGSRAIMRAHDAALRERVARLTEENKALTGQCRQMRDDLEGWAEVELDEAEGRVRLLEQERDEARRLAENWRAMAVSAGWYSETLPWEAVVEGSDG